MTGSTLQKRQAIPAGATNQSSADTVTWRIGRGHHPQRRGKGGLVHVEPAHNPNPIAPAMVEAARSLGIPTFDDQNGEMMEADGGAAITNVRVRDGRRLSVFRSYTYPYMDRHNLTVL